MTFKQAVINYLTENGRNPKSWISIYDIVGREVIPEKYRSNKAKSDYVRQLYKRHIKNSTKAATLPLLFKYPITSEKVCAKEDQTLYQEFLEWKNGKVVDSSIEENKNTFTKEGFHLVISCMHVPFHNKVLTKKILQLIVDLGRKLAGLHFIGDFADLNTLSSHDKGKYPVIKGLTLNQEYDACNSVLDQFDSVLHKGVEKSFLYGNHEDRALRYMSNMQSSKTPISLPHEAFKLKERGYHFQTSWSQDKITLGDHLELIHGTYYNVHCAKKHMDVLRGSVMFGHSHRVQTYIEGSTGAFNIGCLVDLTSPAFNYMARATKSQWQNGFNLVYIDSKGDYYANQAICANNSFVINGKKY